MRFLQLLFRQVRESLEKERPDLIGPEKVHDFFVGQHGICKRAAATQKRDQKQRQHTDAEEAPTVWNRSPT